MPSPKDPIQREEWKRKLRESHLGKPLLKETRTKMSKVRKGVIHSGSFKKGRISWMKGKKGIFKRSLELRKMMSEARIGSKNHFSGKKHKPETIEKIRQYHLGKKMNFSEKGLENKRLACKNRVWTQESRNKIREKRKNWKIPFYDTVPERMMQIALALNGIKFEKHKPFKLGGFWHKVDIFIEPNICVEVDGVHWHLEDEDVKRDLFQTQELTVMGYHVIRIRDKDILKNTQGCAEKVIQLIKELQHKFLPI